MIAEPTIASAGIEVSDSKPVIDWYKPPTTTEECLVRIQALGDRISNHVQFMCTVGSLAGTSGEVKHKAVAGFYERLVMLERALSRIGNDLRLA